VAAVKGPMGPIGMAGVPGVAERPFNPDGPWQITPLWRRSLGFKNRRRQIAIPSVAFDISYWEYKSAREIAHEFLRDNFEVPDAAQEQGVASRVVNSSQWTGR
jgi:hypothetical protein